MSNSQSLRSSFISISKSTQNYQTMNNKLLNKLAPTPRNSEAANPIKFNGKTKLFFVFCLIFTLFAGLFLPLSPTNGTSILPSTFSVIPTVKANNVYYNLSSGVLSLSITPTTTNQITTNDDWSGISSVEGYFGNNLTGTHGVNPQTILGTEFLNNALPSARNTQVNADKGNPSAYNAGGVTEFDRTTTLLPDPDRQFGIGFQGNVQANPYLVFYLNTMGRTGIKMSYTVTDLDGGSNNAVSAIALQYRVGETGNFTNVPEAFIADATQGPNLGGDKTTVKTRVNVTLPAAVDNQPKVQVRLITTNSADTSGSSTPDEWTGINNIVIGQLNTTAATVPISGRVTTQSGNGITNVRLFLTDSQGNIRTATTTEGGYYQFTNVQVGETYILTATGKRYSFSQPVQVLNINEETSEVNFIANSEKRTRSF
jgi:hypothetical protein